MRASTISNYNRRRKGTGRMEVTSRRGHVVAGSCAQEPFSGAWQQCGDAGGVQYGGEGQRIPGGGAWLWRTLESRKLRLMKCRHSLLWRERRSWDEDTRARGPQRPGPSRSTDYNHRSTEQTVGWSVEVDRHRRHHQQGVERRRRSHSPVLSSCFYSGSASRSRNRRIRRSFHWRIHQ